MKKLTLFTMFLAIILIFANCKSADKTTTENRSTPPPTTKMKDLKEVSTITTTKKSGSMDASSASEKSAPPRPASAPAPKRPSPSVAAEPGTLSLKSASSRPRTATTPATTTMSTETSGSYYMSATDDMDMAAPRTSPPPPPPPPAISVRPERSESKKTKKTKGKETAVREEREEPVIEDLPPARQLTAGEVNDFSKWDLWTDISQEDLAEHAERWSILPEKRYAVQVVTEEGAPLTNAPVELQTKSGYVLWQAKTDNTGKAELWSKMFDKKDAAAHKIVVKHKGKSYDRKAVSIFQEGMNTLQIPVKCKAAKSEVDIAFVVDATGSMGDEISYLKAELNDVIQRVKDEMPDTRVNLGSVFYRDTGDKYLTRKSDFSTDISKTVDFIKKQNSDGGGDYPEAVDDALDVALNELNWSDESTSRLLFLVLDAPPHTSEAVNRKMEALTRKAAEKGVRIIPVACSGIRKGTEYLMRAMALATNGTYTFLTDHSGIGGAHIEPTTDEYKVELLNDLLVRVITQFSEIPDCDERYDDVIDDIVNGQNNSQIVWEYYPNPTNGAFTVSSDENIKEVFVTDLNGKLLMRRTGSGDRAAQKIQLNIGDFPSGVYVVKCHFDDDKWESGRVVLVRR